MRWIKASERVPEFGMPLIIKFEERKHICQLYDEARIGDEQKPSFFFSGEDHFDDQFHLIEWLDESPPAFAVEEAEKLYPFKKVNHELFIGCNDLAKYQQFAHITCAGMYTGEIEKGREAIDILKALCALKKHKETVGKDEYYEKAQPEVWKIANKFLEKHNL